MHPDGCAVGRDLGRSVGEPFVYRAVGIAPPAAEGRRLDRVVIEGPDRRVRLSLVVTLDIVGAERDRMQPDPVEIERLGGAADTTGPADPGGTAYRQHRVQGRDQAARTRPPLPPGRRDFLVNR